MTKKNQALFEEFLSALNDVTLDTPVRVQLNEIEEQFELEDIDQILSLLDKIKKSKFRKKGGGMDTKPTKKTKVLFTPADVLYKSYAKEDVQRIFKEETKEETLSKYTKKELIDMYISIKRSKPLSKSDKSDIYNGIQSYFDAGKRGEAIYRNYIERPWEKVK